MMNFIGIDSKPFWRNTPKNFYSGLGTSIIVADDKDFTTKYLEIFNNIAKKYGLNTERVISKGYELHKISANPAFILDILKEATKHWKKVYVHFPIFSLENNEVKVPSKDGPGIERVTIKQFIRKYLTNYFPVVCYWDLQTKKAQLGSECTFYLDAFQGRRTNAWDQVKHNTDFFVFPNGDKVNALISCSDLFNHYLTGKLLFSNDDMGVKEIKGLIAEDFPGLETEVVPVSNWALYNITPIPGEDIDIRSKLKKPTFCIIIEQNSKLPKKVIETSPYLNQIYNHVLQKDGCLKFFDINQDVSFLTEEDYLVYYGPEGERIASDLKNLGYKFRISHVKDLIISSKK